MNYGDHSKPVIRIGVLADTHIPDRVGDLHPDIIPLFQEEKVDLIVHAGDITISPVLEKLETVAPVEAVQGNRDWWQLRNISTQKVLNIKEVKVLITHGHGHFFSYLWGKIPYLLVGYELSQYVQKFSQWKQEFDIVIFGHSHRAENSWVDGRLYFNPGSAYDPLPSHRGPSLGIIEIGEEKKIESRIVKLRELRWKSGKWVEKSFNK